MSPVQYGIKVYVHFAAAPVVTRCGGKIFAALRGSALHAAGVPRVRRFPARVMALRPLAAFWPAARRSPCVRRSVPLCAPCATASPASELRLRTGRGPALPFAAAMRGPQSAAETPCGVLGRPTGPTGPQRHCVSQKLAMRPLVGLEGARDVSARLEAVAFSQHLLS